MKTLIKIIKFLFFGFIGLILFVLVGIYIGHKFIFPIEKSDAPTIADIKEDGFCLGVGCQPKIETAEEYVKVLAAQIRRYNTNAEAFWPDNRVKNQYAIVESIEKKDAWLISPTGEITSLTKSELKELAPVRQPYDTGFLPFETDEIQGMYMALSEVALNNYLSFEKYQYLGTYDMFLTYSHEFFHILEQDVWKSPENIYNRARNERRDNLEARSARNLLYEQVLAAVIANSNTKEQKTLEAIATYVKYKKDFPEDYQDGKYFDRVEGGARYFELNTSLYAAYPDQIKSLEDIDRALVTLAKHENPLTEVGLISEGYAIGGWAGVLLDQLTDNPLEWKKELEEKAEYSTLDLLENLYAGADLPSTDSIGADRKQKVQEAIDAIENKSTKPAIFRMLYQLIF